VIFRKHVFASEVSGRINLYSHFRDFTDELLETHNIYINVTDAENGEIRAITACYADELDISIGGLLKLKVPQLVVEPKLETEISFYNFRYLLGVGNLAQRLAHIFQGLGISNARPDRMPLGYTSIWFNETLAPYAIEPTNIS